MSYVYFRLPHSTHIFRNRLTTEPEEIASLAELNGRRGFVIAPFAPSADCPILLMSTDWEEVELCSEKTDSCSDQAMLNADCDVSAMLIDADYEEERERYAVDFHNYHGQLSAGAFQKIVLARSARLTATEQISPLTLFARACRRYPRMFVTLFSTERSGTWIIATPETLIGGTDGAMHTMALAGTMRLSGANLDFDVEGGAIGKDDIHWSTKNIKEQRCVETYLTECVEQFSDDFSVDGPYTVRAGDLVHLRSDIRFSLNNSEHLGDLINALHPTPAVCGMPKAETRDFILQNESGERSYYSGTISEPLPVHYLMDQGCEKVVVLSTHLKTYERKRVRLSALEALALRPTPLVKTVWQLSHIHEHEERARLLDLERKGRGMMVAPVVESTSYKRYGISSSAAAEFYSEGLRLGEGYLARVKRFCEEE